MVVIAVIVGLFAAGLFLMQMRTIRVERDSRQQQFVSGHLPSPLPDGFYKGSVSNYHGSWIGKTFDQKAGSGINNFSDGNKLYYFRFYPGKGLRDKNLDVLKIDYDNKQDPFWVRFITDEVTETTPGTYLGKIHVRFIGFVFTIGYFSLQK